MLLSKECSKEKIESISYLTEMHDKRLQIEGIKVYLKTNMCIGFIYCRSTPNNEDVKFFNKVFVDCNVLLGDFNLSHRIESEKKKLHEICGDSRVSILNEITRATSNNNLIM